MRNTKTGLLTAVTALLALASVSTAEAAEKMKLTFQWLAGEAHVGFVYAEKLGYYEQAGIDVAFEEGRGSGTTAQLVATGEAELGYADAGAVLNVAAKGAPIKIIAPIFQAGQFGLVFLQESGIKSPKDLEGRKIAVCPGCAEMPLLEAMIAAQDLDRAKIEIVNAEGSAFVGLLAEKKVDAVAETPAGAVLPLEARGIAAANLYFRDHGVPMISLSLIAREDKLASNPELYRRFVGASLKGWAASIANPEAAVDALRERFPDAAAKDKLLTAHTRFSLPSLCLPGAQSLGRPPVEAWEKTYEVLTTRMHFPSDKPMSYYYTTDFVPADAPGC